MTENPASPCGRTDRHDAHEFEVYGRTFRCPGAEATPESQAARPAPTRARLLHLLDRMQRGVILPAERDLLADAVRAALGDGGKGRTASDVLVQHDVTRKAMCDALDVGYHLNWQQLVGRAQRSYAANGAWQKEAEQNRLALIEATELPDGVGWSRIIEAAADLRRAARDARDSAEAAGGDCERAEAAPTRLSAMVDEYGTGARQLSEKLRDARAAIARVRAAVADARACTQEIAPGPWACSECGVDHLAAAEAALDGTTPPKPGDRITAEQHAALTAAGHELGAVITAEAARDALGEQPAEPEPIAPEPIPCDTYQPSSSPEESGLCASCGMADWKHAAEPEPRPLVISIDPDRIAAVLTRAAEIGAQLRDAFRVDR